jgi:hypothetical protein
MSLLLDRMLGAYAAGEVAYCMDDELHTNPHRAGTVLHTAWHDGWIAACKERSHKPRLQMPSSEVPSHGTVRRLRIRAHQ